MAKVSDTVAALALPVVEKAGCTLWDVEYVKEAGAWFLRVYIDREGGVDMNLCEAFHRAIDEPLDELDPTYGAEYTLNCSSAGLDRPFKTERDFIKHIGEKIEVHFYAPFEGKKYYEGELLSYTDGVIAIRTERGEVAIPRDKTAKVCLFIDV